MLSYGGQIRNPNSITMHQRSISNIAIKMFKIWDRSALSHEGAVIPRFHGRLTKLTVRHVHVCKTITIVMYNVE